MRVTFPLKLSKKSKYLFAYFIHHHLSISFPSFVFPTCLKCSNVRLTHKKDDKTNKAIYRFISECMRLDC